MLLQTGFADSSVIPALGPDIQASDAFGSIDLHSDLAPLAVLCGVRGAVRQDVLILQFHGNLCTDVFKIVHGVGKERMPTGQIRELFNECAAGAATAELRVEVADDTDTV